MSGDRRFARALIASVVVHAVASHVLGDLRLHPSAHEDPLPIEVRLLQPPAVEDKLAVAAPPVAPRPQFQPRTAPAQRLVAPRPQPMAAPKARPGQGAPAPAAEPDPAPAPAAAPVMETAEAVAPAPTPPVAAVTPEPSPATEAAPDRLALQARYGRDIRDAMEATKSYPRVARDRGWQGTVKVRFRFLPGGNLDAVEVVDSSGFPILDEHAMKMARAADLPRVPATLAATGFELEVPIHFRLRG
jgi:protein TonB